MRVRETGVELGVSEIKDGDPLYLEQKSCIFNVFMYR
jgi:hypothetical protein